MELLERVRQLHEVAVIFIAQNPPVRRWRAECGCGWTSVGATCLDVALDGQWHTITVLAT